MHGRRSLKLTLENFIDDPETFYRRYNHPPTESTSKRERHFPPTPDFVRLIDELRVLSPKVNMADKNPLGPILGPLIKLL